VRTSTMDILPTLREWIGLPPAALDQGVSLLPALRGEEEPPAERTFFGDLRCPPWFDSHVIKSVIQSDHKFILTLPDAVELYDLAADPREHHSLTDQEPALVAELRAQLVTFEKTCPIFDRESAEITLDAAEIRKLKSLGYVK